MSDMTIRSCAEERIRTSTSLLARVPQACFSTIPTLGRFADFIKFPTPLRTIP